MFLWKALKKFKSERKFVTADGTDFQKEDSKLNGVIFKGLSPATTPFGKRKFINIGESMISRVTILSIEKRDYENYLLAIAN